MKTLNWVAWLFVTGILVGCAAEETVPAGKTAPAGPPHSCPFANPGLVTVTINYQAKNIVAAPSPVDAIQGDVIQFIIVGANGTLVETEGATTDAAWLLGGAVKTPGNQRFFVCVPRDLFEQRRGRTDPQVKDFKYNVKATGHPTLDPVVTVSEF